jgi:hypothetical protein
VPIVEGQGGLILDQGLGVLAAPAQRSGQIAMPLGLIWCSCGCLAKVVDGLLILSCVLIGQTQLMSVDGGPWIEGSRLFVLPTGLVPTAFGSVQSAQLVMPQRLAGLQLQGLFQVGGRLLVLVLPGKDNAGLSIERAISWLQCDGVLDRCSGFTKAASLAVGVSHFPENACVLGVQLQRLAQFLERLGVAAQPVECSADLVEVGRRLGLARQCLIKGVERCLEVPLLLEGDAQL